MRKFFFVLMLIISSPFAFADNSESTLLLAKKLESVHTFLADFSQEVLDDKNQVIQRSVGRVQFDRSYHHQALFYWKVNSPSVSTMIFREGKIIFYDPDLNQATIKKVNEKDPDVLPLMLLTGDPIKVLNNFLVTSKDAQHFVLQPKLKDKDTLLLGVMLELTPEGAIEKIQYETTLGPRTQILFSHEYINQPLNYALFFEKLPKNTDFVEVK